MHVELHDIQTDEGECARLRALRDDLRDMDQRPPVNPRPIHIARRLHASLSANVKIQTDVYVRCGDPLAQELAEPLLVIFFEGFEREKTAAELFKCQVGLSIACPLRTGSFARIIADPDQEQVLGLDHTGAKEMSQEIPAPVALTARKSTRLNSSHLVISYA